MKNWMTWTCVALALCFVAGVTYAQDRPKMDGTRVSGKVTAVAEDGASITVSVKKEGAEAVDQKFAIVKEGEGATKISVGREANKTLADVKVGANVTVVYKKAGEVNTALMIRVITGEGGKKREGGKTGG